jgi:hypothetical protein
VLQADVVWKKKYEKGQRKKEYNVREKEKWRKDEKKTLLSDRYRDPCL